MATGTVDGNTHVVGFAHSGTYATALTDGDTLVITLPRVARSVAVLTPVAMRWAAMSGLSLALTISQSVPTNIGTWFERDRQFTEIVLHNNSGGTIAASTISWDAELTEIPSSQYPSTTTANGFAGYDAAHSTGSGNTLDTETPS